MYGAYGVYVCIRALMSKWMCACVCVCVCVCVCEQVGVRACVQACGWVCDNKGVTRCAQKGFITIFCRLRLILFLRTWSHSTVSTVSTPAKKTFHQKPFFLSLQVLVSPFDRAIYLTTKSNSSSTPNFLLFLSQLAESGRITTTDERWVALDR